MADIKKTLKEQVLARIEDDKKALAQGQKVKGVKPERVNEIRFVDEEADKK